MVSFKCFFFFFSSRRRHTRWNCDWSSDVCSSDLAGVTAAPVYHHHPHRPQEFDAMPRDMAGQARAALENLKRGLEAAGASFTDVVTATRFVTDLSDQDALNRVWAEYFGDAKPATTTVQAVRLATDPRCFVEINAVA